MGFEPLSLVLHTLGAYWLPCTLIMLAACVMSVYKNTARSMHATSQTAQDNSAILSFISALVPARRTQDSQSQQSEQQPLPTRRPKRNMRYHNKSARHPKAKKVASPAAKPSTAQPYDVFLVLDLEGTCELGTNFDYPNEIIVRDIISTLLNPSLRFGRP